MGNHRLMDMSGYIFHAFSVLEVPCLAFFFMLDTTIIDLDFKRRR
jgi:hypothetical protein